MTVYNLNDEQMEELVRRYCQKFDLDESEVNYDDLYQYYEDHDDEFETELEDINDALDLRSLGYEWIM